MSYQDYVEASETLFGETFEEENRDTYQELNLNEIIQEVGLKEDEPLTEQEIEDLDEEIVDKDMTQPRKELKSLPRQRNIFKESVEPENVFQTRLKIYEILENLKVDKKYYLDPGSLDMLSRIINNKYWYNTVYDKTTEETVQYLMSLI